jgi:hypothetical protein
MEVSSLTPRFAGVVGSAVVFSRPRFRQRQQRHFFRSANTIQIDLLTSLKTCSVIEGPRSDRSAVAKLVRRTLPLCYTLGEHARRIHGGSTKLGIA